jgi:large subunit ribosomal protein L10
MPTQAKIDAVAELRARVEKSAAIYLAEYKGLNVKAISELRKQVRNNGAQMIVVKNRLLNLALAGTAAEGLTAHLKGPNAVIFCDADPVTPAKAIADFAKTHDVIAWKGGWVEGTIFDGTGIARVAELPPRDQLIAQVVGAVASPLSGFVLTLSGLVSDLVYTLQAVADKKGEAA